MSAFRFIGGMGLGFDLSCATVYIVEIAATDMRGVCGCLVQFMGSMGILYTFTVGYWLDWIHLAIANACVVFPFIIAMFFVPESPSWLVMKGKEYSAMESLEWLRGRENRSALEKELEKIKRDCAMRKAQRTSIVQLKDFWKPFVVCLILMAFFNFSGFTVLIYYSVTIFNMAESSVDSKAAAIIVGIDLVVSCIIAILIVGRLNRRVLMYSTIFGMGLCQTLLGYCMTVTESKEADITAFLSANNLTERAAVEGRAIVLEEAEYVDDTSSVFGVLPLVAVLGFLFIANVG